MKNCPNCGAQIKDDSLFCTECGKPIPQGSLCPHCGASINEGDAFCQICGKRINEPPSEEIITNDEEKKNGFKKYLPYVLGAFVLLMIIGYCSSNESLNNEVDSKSESTPSDEETIQETKEVTVDPILKLAMVAADADRIYDFQEGLAGFEKEGKIGVVNTKGDIIVPPTYEKGLSLVKKSGGITNAILFFDGMAVVKKNGKYGYIDKNGKEVIPCTFDYAVSFSEGYGVVIKDDKYGVIDKNGKQIVPYKYDYISEFCNGAALVQIGEKNGFINCKGKEIVPVKYLQGDDTCYFSDGLAMIITQPEEDVLKVGYVNKYGEEVIEPIYDGAGMFHEGLAVVYKDGMCGYIDTKGNEVIPFIYEGASGFVDGMAVVNTDSKYQIIDKKGKAITEPVYDYFYGISEGLAFLGKNDLYGLVDKNGKEIVPFKYSWGEVDKCRGGFIRVEKNGKWGFLDKNGKQAIPCIYDAVRDFSDGYAVVSKDGINGYVDTEGKCTLDISDSELKSVITNKKGENEEKERIREAEKERKRLEEHNSNSSNYAEYVGRWSYYISSGGQRLKVYTAVIKGDNTAKFITFLPDGSLNTSIDFRQCVFTNGFVFFTDNGDINIKGTPRFKLGSSGLQTTDGERLIKE